MDRLACVDLPHFPLQLLLRRRPEFAGFPVAVIDRDSPQGKLLFVDEQARRRGIRPGLSYAAALSISRELRAEVVEPEEVEEGVKGLVARLTSFSPAIEPSPAPPGVFWIDASGLEHLYPSQVQWGERVRASCLEEHRVVRVAIGFSRYGAFAATRAIRDVIVFTSADEEQAYIRKIPLVRLDIDPKLVASLEKLGITQLGPFLDLPAAGIRDRFGREALALHRLASNRQWCPLNPVHFEEPIRETLRFDLPITDVTSILFLVQQRLANIVPSLMKHGVALQQLDVELKLEHGGVHREELRPASPSSDLKVLMNLVILRFEGLLLRDEVTELHLAIHPAPTQRRQDGLFPLNPRRDLDAAARAFARVRAAFGDRALYRATLREAHLPEASFAWEPLDRVDLPTAKNVLIPPAIRRIRTQPRSLSLRNRLQRNDGWLLASLNQGAVVACDGPYIVSGGWWAREVHREYHSVETARGDLLWVYYDRGRRRWFEQGTIE